MPGIADGPCSSYAQIVARWGTIAPTISQVTTVTFLTAHSNDADPIVAKPVVKNGGYLKFTTVPHTVFTGTISSVANANRTSASLWQATFTGLGSTCINAGCMMIDSTAGGNAWLLDDPAASGSTYSISAPMSPASVTAIGSPLGNIAAEKTLANSDSVTVVTFPKLNIVDLEPVIDTINGGGAGVVIYRDDIFSPQGTSAVMIGGGVLLAETASTRVLGTANTGGGWSENLSTEYAYSHELYNVQQTGATWVQGQQGFPIIYGDAGGTFLIYGGTINGNANGTRLVNVNLQQDVVLAGAAHGGFILQNALLASPYIASDNALYCFGPCSIDYDNLHTTSGNNIWGPGELIVGLGNGFVRYRSDTSAVNTFLQTGGFTLFGSGSTGCSMSLADASVTSCGIALTPSNLDLANTGPGTGFGGFAFYPGGGSVFKASP